MTITLPALPSGVSWSVCLRDARSGRVLAEHGADQVVPTASIGKVFALIEAARRIVAGDLDPAEELGWDLDERVADSGLWHLLRQPALCLDDLCVLIGAVSDNLAANVVIRRLGLEPIAATTHALGLRDSALLDRARDERRPADPAALSRGRADELSDLMARLHRDEVIGAAVSARVRQWLAGTTDLSMVGGAFGLDPLAHRADERGVRLWSKTGTDPGVRADIGVVEASARTIAYAVLAHWDATGPDRRDDVLAAMRAIGTRIAG
ncbi:serine hydrolase [Aeromicrobium piscarium]|uniref:Serine hydrolase n=1 Tax=Aeromicrobium piscarium TaxID=2590901 RepID=A0A554SDE5_9ACTN|nr:serine hydrolase [Aeromicrobium piscarium]TSD64371.1 serine hydrolase [Aeromicrobium piscarium]